MSNSYCITFDDVECVIPTEKTIEIISNEELKILEEYCQCEHCIIPWYNPLKYITNGDINCLKYMDCNVFNMKIINKSREHMKKINSPTEATPLFK